MVMVYRARLRDSASPHMTTTQHKGTSEWVEMIGGEIIPSTGEEVDESELDDEGRYLLCQR
jgi:hypothetical protein